MNPHDDVELRLRAWMQDAAPDREPAGLVDRVAGGTARVRQRPGTLVRTGLQERRFALPALAPEATWLLLGLALLAATVAAVAIGSRALLVDSVDPGPRLVYVLHGDVYVAEEDGTDPARIVDGEPEAECGGFVGNGGLVSPDGRYIAYRSVWDDACPGIVHIAEADGRLVASVPGVGWDVAWAPDGTRFATWLSLGEQIGVYGVDGTLQATLDGSMVCCGDYDPRWSPDGTALLVPAWAEAYGRFMLGGVPRGDTEQPSVVRLPLDGGEPQAVPADDPGSHRSVSYSPDGTRAAFVQAGPWPWDAPVEPSSDPERARLVVVAADGTPPTAVVEFDPGDQVDVGWRRGPIWSPSGDRIAVVVSRYSADAAGELITESADLRVVDVESGHSTTLASVDGEDELRPMGFSADGDRILVRWEVADGVPSLWSVNGDGSGTTRLVEGADHGEWLSPPADGAGEMPP